MTTPFPISASEERNARIRDKLKREMGDLIFNCLASSETIEIMLNADGVLWVERTGRPMQRLGLMKSTQAEAFINTVAATRNTTIHHASPILECELPGGGSRFEALVPPIVSAPVFTIRRRPGTIFSLGDYVAGGIMTGAQMQYICRAVEERLNIVVAGGTGSGKTTLVNAVIRHISTACPDDRLVIIEDTPEIQCSSPNSVILRTSISIGMGLLGPVTMRLRPDRIIIGEVRGGEALELIKAWNTGHPGGAATIHANDARAALIRLENLLAEATSAPLQNTIAAAVDVIILIARTREGRRVQEMLRVHGFENGKYITSPMEEACALN
jgi:P-type conjugative transfer ATPase TrbB